MGFGRLYDTDPDQFQRLFNIKDIPPRKSSQKTVVMKPQCVRGEICSTLFLITSTYPIVVEILRNSLPVVWEALGSESSRQPDTTCLTT